MRETRSGNQASLALIIQSISLQLADNITTSPNWSKLSSKAVTLNVIEAVSFGGNLHDNLPFAAELGTSLRNNRNSLILKTYVSSKSRIIKRLDVGCLSSLLLTAAFNKQRLNKHKSAHSIKEKEAQTIINLNRRSANRCSK